VRGKGKVLKRPAVRLPKGHVPPNYIVPAKKKKGTYSQSIGYKHFTEHVVVEVASQLPQEKTVICWDTDHMLLLPICAMRKFWDNQSCCKRCSLFQRDEHAEFLQELIENWEKDEVDEDD
jgi:hypothetical protein